MDPYNGQFFPEKETADQNNPDKKREAGQTGIPHNQSQTNGQGTSYSGYSTSSEASRSPIPPVGGYSTRNQESRTDVPGGGNGHGGATPNPYTYQTASPAPGASQPSGNPSGAYHATGSSYTWNGGQQTPAPSYTAPVPRPPVQGGAGKPPKQKKPKGKRTGLKVVAMLLCCLVVSGATAGTFGWMINQGYVNVAGKETGSEGSAAFTINRVVEPEENAQQIASTVSELTPQEIAQQVIPSIVCIQNYQTSGYGGYYRGFDDESMMSPASEGSGVIYTADGYIITNAHVVSGADQLKVVTSDGLSYEAKLVGADTATDLAVIKVDAQRSFTPAVFGSSEDMQVADSVMAIGNPGGLELNSTVTMGYVSALERPITDYNSGYTIKCIQTDAAINPGNSGGALVNMYGQVIGINSSKIAATGYEGLGFAIPSDTAQPIVTSLMEHGYVKDRAVMGIAGEFYDSWSARFYNMTSGYCVFEVLLDNAQKSGLQPYDVITAVDGQDLTASGMLENYLLEKKPGETVTLTVSRAETGEILTIELVLSENTG